MSNDEQLFARTPSNAAALRSALAQSPYFTAHIQGAATDEEVFAYGEGMMRSVIKAAPQFKAATDALVRAWSDAAKGLVRLSRTLET